MGIQKNINEDDAAREIWELIKKAAKPKPRFTGPSGPGGDDGGTGSGDGMKSPMKELGDLIVGGVAGAPRRRAIGAEGDLLQVVDGEPQWVASSGEAGVIGRYRSPLYSTYGGGTLLWDSDGHLMYELRDLE